jgi:hypothetical protein
MSYETYALIAGGIAFLAFIRFGVVMRRKVIKQEFKDVVRNDFRIDYDRAWAKYVPTPQDLMTYQQLLQNQQAQANMGYMMMNGAFAAGGTSVIADIARIIEFRIIYLQRKEVGLLPEGHDQGGPAAHAAQRAAGMEA